MDISTRTILKRTLSITRDHLELDHLTNYEEKIANTSIIYKAYNDYDTAEIPIFDPEKAEEFNKENSAKMRHTHLPFTDSSTEFKLKMDNMLNFYIEKNLWPASNFFNGGSKDSSGGVWGQITGDINAQTDLINLVEGAVGDSCECVNAAKEEVLNAIDEIDIDTTELAKQGTDANANITDITEKLQQIIGANILQPNLQGITFAGGYATDNVLDILMYDKRYIASITSEATKPIIGYAFAICTSLTEANFPNTTSIGGYAFNGCSSLHTVNIPNATSIGTNGFYGCSSLRTAEFPNVTSIGNTAFYNCTSLQTVEFPNATSIGDAAFQQCTSLQTVDFPNATSIGTRSFYNCTRLSKAIFPNATVVNTGAFAGCTLLTYLDISSVMSFTTGSGGPLQSCPNLIDIHMGKNITTNVNLLMVTWNPSNAYLNNTNNLVPAAVRAEHPEWTNRDYLLYCLREHFAANLPDRNGLSSLTITFNGTMKTHINNSPETAAAFTSKNYIIA